VKIFIVVAALAVTCAPVFAVAAVNPVVDAATGYLLGGTSGGKWLNAKATAPSLKGGEIYRLYDSRRFLGAASGKKPEAGDGPCEDTFFVGLTKKPAVAIGGTWNAMPRIPQVIKTSQPVYRAAVAAKLKDHGLTKPVVKITQLLRVDLEGDGEPEVLICATNHAFASPGNPRTASRPGEYSLIALRKVVRGKVKTIMLADEYYPTARVFNAPNIYTLAGVFDLNGDGKMEIVIKGRYYEGDWTSAFEVRGDKAVEVLSAGCGA
jgi:hypothetical protein